MSIDKLPLPDQMGIIPTAKQFMWVSPEYPQQLTDTVNRLFYQFAAKYLGQTQWYYETMTVGKPKDTYARVGMAAEVQNSQTQVSGQAVGEVDSHDLICRFGPKVSDTDCSFSISKSCTRNSPNERLDCRSSTISDHIKLDLDNPNVAVPGFQEDPILSQTFSSEEEWAWDKPPMNLTIKSYFQTLADTFRSSNLTCTNQYPVEHFCLPPTQRVNLERSFANFLTPRLNALDQGELSHRLPYGPALTSKTPYSGLEMSFTQKERRLPGGQEEGKLFETIRCDSFVPSPTYLPSCRFSSYFYPSNSHNSTTVSPYQDKYLNKGSLPGIAPTLLLPMSEPNQAPGSQAATASVSSPGHADPKQPGAAAGSSSLGASQSAAQAKASASQQVKTDSQSQAATASVPSPGHADPKQAGAAAVSSSLGASQSAAQAKASASQQVKTDSQSQATTASVPSSGQADPKQPGAAAGSSSLGASQSAAQAKTSASQQAGASPASPKQIPGAGGGAATGGNAQGTNAHPSGASSTGTPNPSQGASRFKLAVLGVGALAVIAIARKAFRKKDDSSEKRLPKPEGFGNGIRDFSRI